MASSLGNATFGFAGPPASTVREPTAQEVADFFTLRDVFGWARVKGMLTCPGSRAGSLLRAIAGTDWDEAQIDDIANVSPGDFEAMLEDWRYSSDEHIALLDGTDFLRRDELGGD